MLDDSLMVQYPRQWVVRSRQTYETIEYTQLNPTHGSGSVRSCPTYKNRRT
jgi:hypothetical protein